MKNIHVLPTSQPSTLIKDVCKNTFFLVGDFATNHTDFKAQHIYITNLEEIKGGDYYYLPRTNSVYKCIENPTELNLEIRLGVAKIILTTDLDLDGVQAIPDEFLEWFVKNPSCESVKVDLLKRGIYEEYKYKIIIPQKEPKLSNICIKCGVDLYALEGKFVCLKHPKECKGIYLSKETLLIHAAQKKQEQEILEEKLAKIVSKEPSKFWAESDERARIREEKKQHLIDMMKSDEELGLYEEPKQETLEDAAHQILVDYGVKSIGESIGVLSVKKLMVKMSQHHAEKMYSEEEVNNLLYRFLEHIGEKQKRTILNVVPNEWFDRNKKK